MAGRRLAGSPELKRVQRSPANPGGLSWVLEPRPQYKVERRMMTREEEAWWVSSCQLVEESGGGSAVSGYARQAECGT